MADAAGTGTNGGTGSPKALSDKTHAVLKLQIGDNGGVRRINFSRLWCPTAGSAGGGGGSVSYDRLVALAREYSRSATADGGGGHDKEEKEEEKVTITYLDEDGDAITISTDAELAEAFLQFVDRVPPVLRASATVVPTSSFGGGSTIKEIEEEEIEVDEKEEEETDEAQKDESKPKEEECDIEPNPENVPSVVPGDEHTGPTRREATSTGGNNTPTNNNTNSIPPPEPLQQVEVILKGVASVLGSVVSSFHQQAHNNNNRGSRAGGTTTTTSTADPGTAEAERFVREVIQNIHLAGSVHAASTGTPMAAPSSASGRSPTSSNQGEPEPHLTGFDPTFVHGFHTCDGCATKPIVGYRFHATNRPDYDLCTTCHADEARCRDDDGIIMFEPHELDRDRPHQLRWKSLQDAKKPEAGKSGTTTVPDANNNGGAPCTTSSTQHFIHGRHTCDGCLTTPIIGLRFHARNLPDYDLCARCHANYRGGDDGIKFDAVELDRDRPLQLRWQRRQVRRARQARFAHARFENRFAGHGSWRAGVPGGAGGAGDMSSSAHAAAAAAASRRAGAAASEAKKGTEVMDVALKEAISRSLVDAKAKAKVDAAKKAEADANAAKKAEPDDADAASSGDAKLAAEMKDEATKPSPKTAAEELTCDPKLYSGSWGDTFAPKPGQWKCSTCRTVNEVTDTETCCACEEPKSTMKPEQEAGVLFEKERNEEAAALEAEAEAAEHERLEEERLEQERFEAEGADAESQRLEEERLEEEHVAALKAEFEHERLEEERLEQERFEAEEAEAESQRLEEERLEEERIAAREAEMILPDLPTKYTKTNLQSFDMVFGTSPSSESNEAPSTPTKLNEEEIDVATPESAKSNFSKEAEGFGAAAEHLGATLDACAGVIDAMVSELDSRTTEKCPPENPSAPPLEEMEALDSISAMTNSVSSLADAKKEAEEQEPHEIVAAAAKSADDDEEDGWSMVSENTGTLAKATEVIGSALFEFDQKTSTNLAESGIDSIPSSVPTVSSPAPARWESELKTLHELGFNDDKASIEALELLNKESEAPVRVENIVEYLLFTAETDDEAEE